MNRIALGTAQFGAAYGINNSYGRMSEQEVFQVIQEAQKFGVNTLDTAYAYGSSEELIGKFIAGAASRDRLKVISKLPKCGLDDARGIVDLTLKRIGLNYLYGYLLHDFNMYKDEPKFWDFFLGLRDQGKVKKIGVSFYYPEDLKFALDRQIPLDIVQVPYNIFDRRFEDYFGLLKQKNIEIHTRSVFLQGLFLKKPAELDSHFLRIKDKLTLLNELCSKNGISVVSACLNFVLLNECIDKAVVGVDNLNHFQQIMGSISFLPRVNLIRESLLGFKEDDLAILLPFNWKSDK